MRWYPTELRGVDDLQREKKRLLAAQARTPGLDISLKDFIPGKKKKKKDNASPVNGLADMVGDLLKSQTLLETALAAGVPLLRFMPAGIQKRMLARFVREFFGGYLRWKGVKLGWRLLRSFLKKK